VLEAATPLANGQWLRLGISGVLDGYYFDVSRSRPIGPATNEQVGAFEAAIAAVEAGIAALRPGATAGAVANAGLLKQESLGYPLKGVFSGLGHGIGLNQWEAPFLNDSDAREVGAPSVNATTLNENMTLALRVTIATEGKIVLFGDSFQVTAAGAKSFLG